MTENLERENLDLQNEIRLREKKSFWKGVLIGSISTFGIMVILSVFVGGILLVTGITKNQMAVLENGENFAIGEESKLSSEELEKIQNKTEQILDTGFLTEAALIHSYIEDFYLYESEEEDLQDGMLMGMVASLKDPYSIYYNEEELSSFEDSTQGEYVGIGAAVTQEISTGIVRISKPYEGTPSAEAGLLPGDIVVSVDGTQVTGMELTQVVNLIKGEAGTRTTLNIYREQEESYMDVEIERRMVEIPTVISEMLPQDIGYIEVTGFEGVTTEQFIQKYEELKNQGMKKVIVDLRNNGGGRVDTVEAMLDYLLPEGVIFYVKDKAGTTSMEYTSDRDAALDIPIVVLVNENTASAAEIFAGNIQEFGLGTVVGTTTYGKGVMQQLFYTNEERSAAVKLTVADYYIHNDKNINQVGITPDVEIELDEEAVRDPELTKEKDNQLQKAIEILK